MEAALIKIFETLTASGPVGLIIAACIVGGVVALILFARSKQMFDNAAADARGATFQKDLLEQLKLLRTREEEQREAIDRLQAQVFLFREQLRRLIDQITFLKKGQIAPADIEIPEMKQRFNL